MKVAAIQFKPVKGEIYNNFKNIKALIEEAAGNGAKLIVMPEMATTGYIWNNRKEIQDYVEKIPGPTTTKLCEIASKHDIYVVMGLAEKDESDIYYNSSVLIGPEGIIGKYRKVHPFIADPLWAANGNSGINVFQTKIGNIGMAICMDLNIPETTRVLERKGCNIICAPVNWFGEKLPSNVWITRAIETNCNIIVANRWGKEKNVEFGGKSSIVSSNGNIEVIDGMEDGIVYSDITIKNEKINEKIKKYDFYKNLMLNPYLWNPSAFFKQIDDKIREDIEFKGVAVQTNCDSEDGIIDIVKREIEDNGKFIVFPENSLGYIGENDLKRISEKISIMCKDNASYVVVSGLEKIEKKVYPKIWLIGPNGIEGEHKKIIPRKGEENFLMSDELKTFSSIYGKVGMLFGNEILNMEIPRVLALNAVDILVIVDSNKETLNKMYKDCGIMWSLPMVRAKENNLYVIYANIPKDDGYGYSGIFCPNLIEKPSNYVIREKGEGTIEMILNTGGSPGKFPVSVVKYKPLLHLRNPKHYEVLI